MSPMGTELRHLLGPGPSNCGLKVQNLSSHLLLCCICFWKMVSPLYIYNDPHTVHGSYGD